MTNSASVAPVTSGSDTQVVNAISDSMRYFACNITELCGDMEFTSHFLFQCSRKDKPEQIMDRIFTTYRGNGDKDSDTSVDFDCGVTGCNPVMTEIGKLEFDIMQVHIPVIE